MTVTVSLPKELLEDLKSLAEQQHRSVSGQVAFFCAQGVRRLETPQDDADQKTEAESC